MFGFLMAPPAQQKISRFRNPDSLICGERREALVPGVELLYESVGDARRKFWIKPLRETIWAWLNLFWPLKAIILNFDYMTCVKKLKWIENELKIYKFLIFLLVQPLKRPLRLNVMVFCPQQPKRDQNLKFTPLWSETTTRERCNASLRPISPASFHTSSDHRKRNKQKWKRNH